MDELEATLEQIRKEKRMNDDPLAEVRGLSFEEDLDAMHSRRHQSSTSEELRPQTEGLSGGLRYFSDWSLGVADTTYKSLPNLIGEYVLAPIGKASEYVFGGESMFTRGAQNIFDWTNAYSQASDETRNAVTGGNANYWDNMLHGAGTSAGYYLTGLGASGAVQALWHVAPWIAAGAGYMTRNFLEAMTEGGNTAAELYGQDKSRYNDALLAGLYSLGVNAPTDLLQGVGEGLLSAGLDKLIPGAGFFANYGKGLVTEETNELLQEPRQQLIEQAVKNTFASRDMSLRNFASNLWSEAEKFPQYFNDVAAETAGSTLLTHTLLYPLGASGGNVDTNLTAEQRYDRLKKVREDLQPQIDTLHSQIDELRRQSPTEGEDDQTKTLRDLEAQVSVLEGVANEYDNALANFWGSTNVITNPVQDEYMDFFPDRDELANAPAPEPTTMPSTEAVQPDMAIPETETGQPVMSVNELQQTNQTGEITPEQTIEPEIQQSENQEPEVSQRDGKEDFSLDTWLSENKSNGEEEQYRQGHGSTDSGVSSVITGQLGTTQDDAGQQAEHPLNEVNPAEVVTDNGSQNNTAQGVGSGADAVTGLLGNDSNGNPETTTGDNATASNTATPEQTISITYTDSDGNEHQLTARTAEFGYKHPNQKKYFGRYVEFRDENGKVVARYSPYNGILQAANGVQDTDSIRDAVARNFSTDLGGMPASRNLQKLGYLNERGKLIHDGNQEYRSQYRGRLDTNPEGVAYHSANLNSPTQRRIDTRTLEQRKADDKARRVSEKRVRKGITKNLMQAYIDYVQDRRRKRHRYYRHQGKRQLIMDSRAYEGKPVKATLASVRRAFNYIMSSFGEISDDVKHLPRLYKHYRTQAKATAQIASGMLNGLAAAYGMPVDELYRDGMGLEIVFDKDLAKSGSRGETRINPPYYDEKNKLHRGKITIALSPDLNESTSPHEFGHAFLKEYGIAVATVPDLPQSVKDNWYKLSKWLGISDIDPMASKDERKARGQDERYTNGQEKFAVALEKYLAEGKAPFGWLKKVFRQFKTWMSHVYPAINSISYLGSDGSMHGVELSPEVREMFDSLFKDVPYVPSETNRQARLALSREVGQGSQGEEFLNQSVSGQNYSLGRQNSIQDLIGVMQTDTGRKNSGQVWVDYAAVSKKEAQRL